MMSDLYGGSPRYYFIDFGLSRHIPRPWPCEPRLLPPKPQVTHKSPEWSTTTPFNPFPHDVYCVAVSLRFKAERWDDNKYWDRIPAFTKLMNAMEHRDPRQRPTARQALQSLEAIMYTLSDELCTLSFADRWNYRSFRRASPPTPPLSVTSSSDESDSGGEDMEDILAKPTLPSPPTKKSLSLRDPFTFAALKASI